MGSLYSNDGNVSCIISNVPTSLLENVKVGIVILLWVFSPPIFPSLSSILVKTGGVISISNVGISKISLLFELSVNVILISLYIPLFNVLKIIVVSLYFSVVVIELL